MRVLNLYAGIGGNRKLWTDVEVTAVEMNPKIAEIYQDFFPDDTVIVGDAHKYLLDHFEEFDFIWSSPPCPSHSKVRMMASKHGDYDRIFPDLKLYEEVIFLKHYYKGKWCVENVVAFYKPLIKPFEIDRHYFWANFHIRNISIPTRHTGHNKITGTTKMYGFDLIGKDCGHRKDQVIRNLVRPELGLHILNESKRDLQPELFRS